jgi:poly-gamma-glutamate capsule biosynthesis protein CapA/YwtB (metallophosphatase superfamily)
MIRIRGMRLLLACLLLAIFTPAGWAALDISGTVTDESGRPIAGAQVQLGGGRTFTDADGRFTLATETAGHYRLRFSAADHYTMIHGFSPLEFDWWATETGSVQLPVVRLVPQAEGRIQLVFGGDTMMGRRFVRPYPGEPVLIRPDHAEEDARALLSHLKPYMELADYASVNLETQVMHEEPESAAPKSYTFYSPPEILAALEYAGIDYVTLGNNHSNDYLEPGLTSTIDLLTASDLAWSGAGLNEQDALRAQRVEIGGQPISFLGFVGWAGNFSPNQVAQGADKGGAAFGTRENIAVTVQREIGAGRLPVIQYHGSREYADEPTLATESKLKQGIDQGAVLAIAHHPHVVQGFEIYRDRLIAYSLGNFIFDQFHYATMYSYIVYVWMDGDRFHRAEVTPIHIQGYTPMPATDTVRRKVLQRTFDLSARRGVALQASGGNAVILPGPEGAGPAGRTVLDMDISEGAHGDATVIPLYGGAWNAPIGSIADPGNSGRRIRLGHNLLPTGHLESHDLFGAPDRGWIEEGGQSVIDVEDAPSGRKVMRLNVPAGESHGRVGMRTFEYTFEPGTPTTFVVRARADAPATVIAYQQWRKRNQDRFDALENGELRPIGQRRLHAAGWQELRFDFDSPRVTAISYRVVLHVEPDDDTTGHVSWFDDLALIEWLSPPLESGALPPHVSSARASHIDRAD